MEKHMTVPAGKDQLCQLKAGDYVYLTGTIYTARDAAHKRMNESLDQGEKLPVKLEAGDLLYGTISGKRRKTNRFSRTNNCKQNG